MSQRLRTHHVDASVLAVVDLVVPYDRVAVRPDLDARERVAVDVVVLDQAAALAEDVHAALVAVVDLVLPASHAYHRVHRYNVLYA